MTALLLLALTAVAAAGPLGGAASDTGGVPKVRLEVKLLDREFPAGGTVRLGLLYHVPEGTHMTGTFRDVAVASDPAVVLGEPVFPPLSVPGEIPYWKGDVMAVLPVTLPAVAGPLALTVTAESQLCREGDAGLCYPPASSLATLTLDVTAPADGAPTAAAAAPDQGGGLQGRLERALDEGSWLAFLLVFLGGVLASFTPCVYPMIPITISFIGGSAKGNPAKGFVLSLWYVLGIALVYSVLGLVAAATGGAFGQATQTPVFAGVVAAVIGAMALSMAGMFDIQLPSSLTSKVGGGRTGFLGPLLMGMAMGMIAAPCVGPVLIVLLTWVATSGSLFMGFWLLFAFAMGLGMLFVALGTFSGLLTALPGAGGWMQTVKHVFAVVLLALALWFVRLYLPLWLLTFVFGMGLMLMVSAWGAWRPLEAHAGARESLDKGFLRFLWMAGTLLALLGGLRGFAPDLLPTGGAATVAADAGHAEPAWLTDEDTAFARAARDGMPVVMDFWAEWCAACIELDHQTWNQAEVLALAERFVPVKMDMTARNDRNKARNERYGVIGMPTVIFFDSEGNELERFSGFKDARAMAAVMERVLARVQ
ncbi:MAG TPA: cytochrome c biogenesis protein CcdA [Candidatus Krumholzibacteria bacterium]|nr:cytochrome c biogenesis protein CcdA [Candidatus Krumholzibacteria bacterium]